MALSNWFTRDEWNAVYFAGLKASLDGKEWNNLGEQMRLGIVELHKAGYKFRGIDVDENGGYTKRIQCGQGNETVLAELIGGYGGFNKLDRAKETLRFAEKELPTMNFQWLKDAIKDFEVEEKEASDE